jgi:hypothetical protein
VRHRFRHIFFAALLFVISGSLLSVSSASSDQHAVEAALKQHVQAGVTPADQVIARFGQPASREPRRGPGQSEVLGYNHQTVAPKMFPLLPLLSFINDAAADTFFEVSDGVVTRYWTVM